MIKTQAAGPTCIGELGRVHRAAHPAEEGREGHPEMGNDSGNDLLK